MKRLMPAVLLSLLAPVASAAASVENDPLSAASAQAAGLAASAQALQSAAVNARTEGLRTVVTTPVGQCWERVVKPQEAGNPRIQDVVQQSPSRFCVTEITAHLDIKRAAEIELSGDTEGKKFLGKPYSFEWNPLSELTKEEAADGHWFAVSVPVKQSPGWAGRTGGAWSCGYKLALLFKVDDFGRADIGSLRVVNYRILDPLGTKQEYDSWAGWSVEYRKI